MIDRMNDAVVKALLEAMPAEITVIDENDEVIGWNQHETRIFTRPMTSMGLNFRNCHPEKSLHMVEKIVGDMKAGKMDKASFWIDLGLGADKKEMHKILIQFYALRDAAGKYLGCLEFTQDIEEIRNLKGEKKLLD